MMKIEKEYYTVEMCRNNPRNLYVFGDNLEGIGKSGQACIRDEPNAIGISTKYSCMYSYNDERLAENIQHINAEIEIVKDLIGYDIYDGIVFPAMGLGTGLAQLQTVAPRTFLFLCTALLDNFKFNNLAYLKAIK